MSVYMYAIMYVLYVCVYVCMHIQTIFTFLEWDKGTMEATEDVPGTMTVAEFNISLARFVIVINFESSSEHLYRYILINNSQLKVWQMYDIIVIRKPQIKSK